MNHVVKSMLRNIFNALHLDLTRNLRYDRLTRAIIAASVHDRMSCIDVGAHKGEILELFVKQAPHATHFAFEPIPKFFEPLARRWGANCKVWPYALGDREGETTFQHVLNAPAYSGIRRRSYAIRDPKIRQITVPQRTLDTVIPLSVKIGFIKIDVEGAELLVLQGARALLERDKPKVIFECGLGASDYYEVRPEEIFDFFHQEVKLNLSALSNNSIKHPRPLSKEEFCNCYYTNSEYYFLAFP